MATQIKVISAIQELPKSEDFEFLLTDGISHLIELAQNDDRWKWTDLNKHDPGLTILEQLVYALTDLAYRTKFSIKDLLTSKDGRIPFAASALFPPQEIFPTGPITFADYELMLENAFASEVYGATLEPESTTEEVPDRATRGSSDSYRVSGRYRVILDLRPFTLVNLKKRVKEFLNANRNLGDVFVEVVLLERIWVDLELELELPESTSLQQIVPEIVQTISRTLAPARTFRKYANLRRAGLRNSEIFEGPIPSHGPPAPEDAPGKMEERLQNALANLQTVIAINELKLSQVEESADGDVFRLNTLTLRSNEGQQLQIEVESLPDTETGVSAEKASVSQDIISRSMYREYADPNTFLHPFAGAAELMELLQPGQFVDAGHYDSIQNQFPAVYGLAEGGPSVSASPRRKAQAKQLKAYLLIFEQLLADFLAQLANLNNLFSTKRQERTYFYEPLYMVPDVGPILRGVQSIEAPEIRKWQNTGKFEESANGYIIGLDDLIRHEDDFYTRRGQFLDNLLARFGESPETIWTNPQRIITDKEKILRNFVNLSSDRARGFDKSICPPNANRPKKVDCSSTTESGENLSTLQKRIKLLFEIFPYHIRSLVDQFELRSPDGTEEPLVETGNDYTVFLEVIKAVRSSASDAAEQDFAVKSSGSRFEIVMTIELEGKQQIVYTKRFESSAEALSGLDRLLCRIKDVKWNTQRDYLLIEHVLFLPDNLKTGNMDSGLKVPLAFFQSRLTNIYCDWPGKPYGEDPQFQTKVEKLVDGLTPAHLLGNHVWNPAPVSSGSNESSSEARSRYEQWALECFPPLEIVKDEGGCLIFDGNTSAGKLVSWLLDEVPAYKRFSACGNGGPIPIPDNE